jgi:hypothetical protein
MEDVQGIVQLIGTLETDARNWKGFYFFKIAGAGIVTSLADSNVKTVRTS